MRFCKHGEDFDYCVRAKCRAERALYNTTPGHRDFLTIVAGLVVLNIVLQGFRFYFMVKGCR
jgi:hypothetical protein